MINVNKAFCFRITHRDNLPHILTHGVLTKNHPNADPNFVSIGNLEIIDVRSTTSVRIQGLGNIGDYVPFYFTPRSLMLFNIITGYYAPKFPRRKKEEIIVIRCLIQDLAKRPKWFFTDGQANDGETSHFSDINKLDKIDWTSIQNSKFSKSDGDYDRQRRYQAEFLVHESVPTNLIEAICVYNESMAVWVKSLISQAGLNIPVHIHKPYFFD